jgi:hypothetical protein
MKALNQLHTAYYAIPAGDPSTEMVMEKLPDLYAAIQAVLEESATISGLLATVEDAKGRGVIIHIATEATCAEHLAAERPTE